MAPQYNLIHTPVYKEYFHAHLHYRGRQTSKYLPYHTMVAPRFEVSDIAETVGNHVMDNLCPAGEHL